MEVPEGRCAHREYGCSVRLPPFLALCIFPMWQFLRCILYDKPINKMLSEVLWTFKKLTNLRRGWQLAGQKYRWQPRICNWLLSSCGNCENSQPLVSESNGILWHLVGIQRVGELVGVGGGKKQPTSLVSEMWAKTVRPDIVDQEASVDTWEKGNEQLPQFLVWKKPLDLKQAEGTPEVRVFLRLGSRYQSWHSLR